MLTSPIPIADNERFYLFGMGASRRKIVYQNGIVCDARSGETIFQWEDVSETIYEPLEYRLRLQRKSGDSVTIYEDNHGLWVEDDSLICLSDAPIPSLMRFENSRFAPLLSTLYHQLLTNIAEADRGGMPLPNLFVYDKVWFRDAAMVALCLERTGNLSLLDAWVETLADLLEPFDRNNGGIAEPDNLGQLLTILAVCGKSSTHAIVEKIMDAADNCRKNNHLTGLSDFSEHPVYQTKWLKYGLQRLEMKHVDWKIPAVFDSYSALFWMDFRGEHIAGTGFTESEKTNYPYLGWAAAHFHDRLPDPIPDANSFPLTWEAQASHADYTKMTNLGTVYPTGKICTPHTWHAAEMFLALLDLGVSKIR